MSFPSRIAICAAVSFAFISNSQAANFTLTNDFNTKMYVWFYPERAIDWRRPPTVLSAKFPTDEVDLESGLRHYLAINDAVNNADHFGWYDFDKVAATYSKNGKPADIAVSEFYVTEERTRTVDITKTRTEQRERSYKVAKMVPEKRTAIVRVWDSCRSQWVWMERTYTILKPVYEERTMTYSVEVPYTEQVEQNYSVRVRKPELTVRVDGKTIRIAPIEAATIK